MDTDVNANIIVEATKEYQQNTLLPQRILLKRSEREREREREVGVDRHCKLLPSVICSRSVIRIRACREVNTLYELFAPWFTLARDRRKLSRHGEIFE